MAQTIEGAKKCAAKKLGMSLQEYATKLAERLKHCTKCKSWKPLEAFTIDNSRHDGLSAKCRQCSSKKGYQDEMTRSERINAGWVNRRASFIPPMKGKTMSDESRHKMSEAEKNHPSNRLEKKHTPETRAKISAVTLEGTPRGEAHYAYKHGEHQRNLDVRRTVKYSEWRIAVFTRDKFTCQDCGDCRGGNLQAHHIKGFAEHVESRFDIDNGITLCQTCHERRHLKPIPLAKCRRKKHPHPTP